MGRAKPVNLGHLSFPTRGEAQKYFSALLARTEIGTVLTGQDFLDVEALLSGHCDAQNKIGKGVKSLTVDPAEEGGKCFHVVRADDTKDNFSIKKCIVGDAPPFTNFSVACRKAVKARLHEFKAAYFEENQNDSFQVLCPETNIWLNFDEAVVDHRPPMCFSVIVKFFIQSKSIDLSKIEYVCEGLYGHEFVDQKLAHEFFDWHKATAILRVIERTRNLQKAHLGRIKLTKADGQLF